MMLRVRTCLVRVITLLLCLLLAGYGRRQPLSDDPLPSWKDGHAKRAILAFVAETTRPGGRFVPPEDRVATFDQDGTLWVSHPIYTQAAFALDRVRDLAPQHPEWNQKEPFRTVLSGDPHALAKLSESDWAPLSWRLTRA